MPLMVGSLPVMRQAANKPPAWDQAAHCLLPLRLQCISRQRSKVGHSEPLPMCMQLPPGLTTGVFWLNTLGYTCSEEMSTTKGGATGLAPGRDGQECSSSGQLSADKAGGDQADVQGDVPVPWWYTPKRLLVSPAATPVLRDLIRDNIVAVARYLTALEQLVQLQALE